MKLYVIKDRETGLYTHHRGGWSTFENAQFYRTTGPATSRMRYTVNRDLPLQVIAVAIEEPI